MSAVEQCGSTELHEPHDACAGLSEYDVIVGVGCPDCLAPVGAPCRFSAVPRDGTDTWPVTAVHGGRRDVAFIERGTCKLCGLLLLRDKRTDRVWHPEMITQTCPPLPDPATHWNDYAIAVQNGAVPGEPGLLNFVPECEQPTPDVGVLAQVDSAVRQHVADDEAEAAGFKLSPLMCPECAAGKCVNCDGRALHPVTDMIVACECSHGGTH